MNSNHIKLLVTLTAVATTSLAHAVDVVTRRSDNQSIRGTFTKMAVNEVTITRANKEEVTISVADLKSVQFDKEPITLLPARSNERSGALKDAHTKLTDIKKGYGGADKRLKIELDFLIARVLAKQALVDPAQADAAATALEAFRAANKTNFRYLESTLLHASVLSLKGDAAQGTALLQEVQNSGVPGYQLQAGVDLGRLLLKDGKAAEAQAAFEAVIQQAGNDAGAAGAKFDSQLGLALCQKQQNQLDEAIATLNQVIEDTPANETRTLAEAWVRKGDCLRQQQKTKAALLAYLYVDTLYKGESVQHAESLLRLSELWGPSGHEDRAADASARLADRYPNSQWARKVGGGG